MTRHLLQRFVVLSLGCLAPAPLPFVCMVLEFELPLNRPASWSLGFWNGRVRVSNWPEVEASNRRADAYAKEYWARRRYYQDVLGTPPPAFTPPPRIKPR